MAQQRKQENLNYKQLMENEMDFLSDLKKQKIHDYATIIMMIEDFDRICNIFEKEISNYEAVMAEHSNDRVFLDNYNKTKIDYTNSLLEYFSETYSSSVDLLRSLLVSIDTFYRFKDIVLK